MGVDMLIQMRHAQARYSIFFRMGLLADRDVKCILFHIQTILIISVNKIYFKKAGILCFFLEFILWMFYSYT
jgi:hypothetical protein